MSFVFAERAKAKSVKSERDSHSAGSMVNVWTNRKQKVICEGPSKGPRDEEGVVDEFIQNTSITALTLVVKRRRWVSKILWLVVTLLSLAIAIYQSVMLIDDYLQCNVRESREFLAQQFAPFPSITVCDVNPVSWVHLRRTNHPLLNLLTRANQSEMEEVLVTALLRMSAEERHFLYNQSTPFRPKGVFPQFDFPPSHVSFRDLYLGQCTTFNPQLGGFISQLVGSCNLYSMHITIPVNLEEKIPGLHPSTIAYVMVHPRGTPPAHRLERTIHVAPYDIITVNIEQFLTEIEEKNINRSDQLTCIDDTKSIKFGTIFDEPGKRHYSYTKIGCIFNEIQKRGLRDDCVDIQTPLEYVRVPNVDNITICSDSSPLPVSPEACPALCKELDVSSSVTRWSRLINEEISRRMEQRRANNSNSTMGMTSQEELMSAAAGSMDAVVSVYQTKGYYKVSKSAVSSLYDLVGMIGGNVGLWLGVSMLSVWELMELGCALALKKLRRGRKTNDNGPNPSCNIVHVLQYQPTPNEVVLQVTHE